MSLLLKYIDAPPQNPIDFKIPLSDPMDWPLIPSIQDLKKALSNNENDDSVPSYSTSEVSHEKIIAIEAYLTSINFANEDSAFFTALYHTSQNFIFMNYNRAKHELSCQCGAHYTVYYDKTLKCYKIRVDKSHSHCMESSSSKRADALYSISNKNLTYKFNRDKEVTIQTNRDILGLSKPFTDYEGTVGTYKGITIQPILSAFDTATDITTGKITFSFSGDVKLSWEEAAASSADQNEEFYFPEFTASLTTKSGIFTKDDVDVKYPSGLPWWAILLIVIAVIIVIAIIVVVIILVIKKKKDKSSSSSSSSSKKKNAEADGAA